MRFESVCGEESANHRDDSAYELSSSWLKMLQPDKEFSGQGMCGVVGGA